MVVEDMLEEEDISDQEGGLDFVVSKETVNRFKVAVHKLAHKTVESVKKGVDEIKNITSQYPQLKCRVNETLAEYIRENPWKAASFPLTISAIGALGWRVVDFVRDVYDRYTYAEDKAYRTIKYAQRPGSTPTLDYWYLLQHYFWKGRAASTRAYVHPFKNMFKEQRLKEKKSWFNWKLLPFTALAAISGAAAMRYLRRQQPQPHLPQVSPNSRSKYYEFLRRLHQRIVNRPETLPHNIELALN